MSSLGILSIGFGGFVLLFLLSVLGTWIAHLMGEPSESERNAATDRMARVRENATMGNTSNAEMRRKYPEIYGADQG